VKKKPKRKRMTLAQFFTALGKLKGNGWEWSAVGIRCAYGYCPILAVYKAAGGKARWDNDAYPSAAAALGLSQAQAHAIAGAADGDPSVQAAALQARLTRVLGLPL
jgi:hypothetical protein